jgi:tol-pal system protein YbgF
MRWPGLALPLFILAFSAGCAHSAPEPEADPAPAQLARLRQENADLRRRVVSLEEQVRFLEGASLDGAPGRGLPVVRLAPAEPAPTGAARAPERPPVLRSPVTLGAPPQPTEPVPGEAEGAGAVEVGPPRSYKLVGSRLVELTRKPRPPRRSGPREKQKSGVGGEYDAAMAMYSAGQYAEAEAAFASFVGRFPDHDYADNALYWQGESAYDQAHYADALAAFTEVVERYGGGNKAPDALLKIGLCYGRLGDLGNARDVLGQLVAAYPQAGATRIAQAKLAELSEAP